jgi:hypothetical protein
MIQDARSHEITIGPIVCPETSVSNYHCTLRNIPEERRSYLHRGGTLKSRNGCGRGHSSQLVVPCWSVSVFCWQLQLPEFYFLDAPGCDLTVSLTLMYHKFFLLPDLVLLAFNKTQGFRPAFIKPSCQLRGPRSRFVAVRDVLIILQPRAALV